MRNQYSGLTVFNAAEFERRVALEERVEPLAEDVFKGGNIADLAARFPDAAAALREAAKLGADEVITAFGPVTVSVGVVDHGP